MDPAEYRQLVDNIRADGVPTSLALAYLGDDGGLEILSGHHRTDATIEAGFTEGDVIVILTRLTEERKKAIQASHNAIHGKDDMSLLAKLWEGMDLDSKRYSGLSEDTFKDFGDLKLDSLVSAKPRYEESLFLFLPEDGEVVEAALEKLGKGRKSLKLHAVPLASWDPFFDAMVRTKAKMQVYNSGVALLTMCELAMERLDQLEAEAEAAAKAELDSQLDTKSTPDLARMPSAAAPAASPDRVKSKKKAVA